MADFAFKEGSIGFWLIYLLVFIAWFVIHVLDYKYLKEDKAPSFLQTLFFNPTSIFNIIDNVLNILIVLTVLLNVFRLICTIIYGFMPA